MGRVRVAGFGVSVDGFGAGPDQSLEHPLGFGGRAPIVMEGGTTFHFVTDGIESALAQAKAGTSGE